MAPRRSSRLAAAPAATVIAPPQPARKKRAPKKKVTKGTKKRRTGLTTAIIPSSSLGVVDPESDIHGGIMDLDNEPCDVMLVLVDPAKHMDKFFILQLIERIPIQGSGSSSYVVYTRWGRTGTSGQALEQDFDEYGEALDGFEDKFKQKTGLTWKNRNEPTVGNKYRFIQQNFSAKKAGFVGANWQYWVDDGVDGKVNGWYDYSADGAAQAERLYQEHAFNSRLTTRLVDSGVWTYDVNLTQMIQTNVKHPNKTSRRIRRCPDGEDFDDVAPIVTAHAPAPVLSMSPPTPVKSAPVAMVTPNFSPVKPPPCKVATKSPPVDTDIDLFYPTTPSSSFSVAKDDNNEWYDAVLNQCNITCGNNNNKYYRLQLLESSGAFYVWTKWGRVGETAKANTKDLKGPMSRIEAAFKLFAKKYKDKTGNVWGAQTFVPKKNKYTRIEIDNEVEVKEEFKMVNVKSENIEYLPSTLEPKTKELIEVLFSKDMRDEALASFNLDLKRLPLGVPSKQQIQIGVDVLNEIEDKLNGGAVADSYQELSSRFYTSIPHSFGRRRPPPIDTQERLQERYDMTNILFDMFSTNELVRKIEEETDTETKKIPYPADSHYASLKAKLSLVDQKTADFKKIQKYFDTTKGQPGAKIFDVWQVDRNGENNRFKTFEDLDNRKLLWHGTNIAVVAPIITSGLRIMPHSGGRVGSGIYLASMQAKSASYTSGYGAKFACMFLCESPLGKQHVVTSDGPHASGLKKAPTGSNSVHAVGTETPKSWTSMKIDGKTVAIPDAPGSQSGTSSSFHHDEYLVYDEAQVRLRYVVTVKLY